MMPLRTFVLILSACGGWAWSATAQVPRPDLAPPRPFVMPRASDSSLPNGFRWTCVAYGTTPMARVELVIRAGSADDPVGLIGIAELLGEYLREGSRSRDADSLAREVAGLGVVGGEIGIEVGAYETWVWGDVLAESVPALVLVLGDIVQNPSFAPEALARLRANQVRRLTMRRGQAANIAAARVNALLFPDHLADRRASAEDVQALTLTEVRRVHAAHFVASRAHLYVAGRFDAAAVEAAARRAFGAWAAGEAAMPSLVARPAAELAGPRDSPTVHLLDRPGATQARIQISAPIPDPAHSDHPILNQLNTLLGSVQTSRIIANVRELHGYSYNISSRLIRRPGSSQWALTADVATENTAPALREILAELAHVVAVPPTDAELRRFQAFLAGVLVAENATPAGIVDTLRYFDLYGIDAAYRADFVTRTRDVLPVDVHRVARTYLQPSGLTIVVVGDRSALLDPLASMGRIVD